MGRAPARALQRPPRDLRSGRIIARASRATNGSHNIVIVNDQAGKRAHLDAFIVIREPERGPRPHRLRNLDAAGIAGGVLLSRR